MSAARFLSAALRLAAMPFCAVGWQLEAWAARREDGADATIATRCKQTPPDRFCRLETTLTPDQCNHVFQALNEAVQLLPRESEERYLCVNALEMFCEAMGLAERAENSEDGDYYAYFKN